ncbi:hypothetical protein HQQ80_11570 [Microbacteriaceae bacterium VKM Ac-2855]|nr:hypothetical protein [Microbacteriaceae bacterium VKM Ac-2855]
MNDLSRRALLTTGFIAAGTIAGCAPSDPDPASSTSTPTTAEPTPEGTPSMPSAPRILLAFFSRAGENYWYGDRRTLDIGNTEFLAGLIRERVACDVFRIEAVEPYSDSYDDTVARNVREQNEDARPAIAGEIPDAGEYDTIIVASPIWNVRPPMILNTFVESLDWSGKTLFPVTTHAMSGLGRTVEVYTEAAPGASIGEGLAIQGETVADAAPDVEEWVARAGFIPR